MNKNVKNGLLYVTNLWIFIGVVYGTLKANENYPDETRIVMVIFLVILISGGTFLSGYLNSDE